MSRNGQPKVYASSKDANAASALAPVAVYLFSKHDGSITIAILICHKYIPLQWMQKLPRCCKKDPGC